MKKLITCSLTLFVLFSTVNAQSWSEHQKLVSNDRIVFGLLGMSVAIDGNYAIAGAKLVETDANNENPELSAGAAYIYQKSESGVWTQMQKIVAKDRDEGDNFGNAVAIDGEYAVVGALFETGGFQTYLAGAVYIFQNIDGVWTQMQKLVAPDRDAEDEFGFSVAIDGEYIIVGSWLDNVDTGEGVVSRAGSAYIYKNIDGLWKFVQKIVASDLYENDDFGYDVDIDGDYAVIGAKDQDWGNSFNYETGAAYIFKNIDGVWTEVQKLGASNQIGGELFGWSVAIDDDKLVIGSTGDSIDFQGLSTNTGAAYRFKNNGGVWTEVQKLTASDRDEDNYFGSSVAIEGDYTIVGALGNSYDENGNNYCYYSGAAYVYKNMDGVWTQTQKLAASDRCNPVDQLEQFGISVGISGGYAIIGANTESFDETGNNYVKFAGACYIFTEPLLPATYTAFYGERKNNINNLYWQTLTETNLQNMVVERSEDGINFNKIGNVTPQHKAAAYRYDDATEVAGVISYYRILFTDIDGRSERSNVISLIADSYKVLAVSLNPNPFTTSLIIKTETNTGNNTNTVQLSLYDATGKLVLKEQWNAAGGVASHTVSVNHLPKGVYMAEVKMGNEVVRMKVAK